MKLDDLKYGKDNGSREFVGGSVPRNQEPMVTHKHLPSISLSSDYTKPEGEIDVRILFVLSGGEDRERNYFKMLKDDQHLEKIKVAFASKEGQGLNPTQLLEVAKNSVVSKKFTTKEATYRFEEKNGDIIYLLQDIDQFEQEIRGLANEDQPDCLRWIYSNPAFEMWLYYHYFKEPLPNLRDAIGKTTAERILGISKAGGVRLADAEEMVGINDISPVRIDGVQDVNIYYDPFVAAFTVAPDESIPSVTVNEQYYMESFKNDIFEDGVSLYDKVVECHFAYVHELQHWLLETQGQSGLKIKMI